FEVRHEEEPIGALVEPRQQDWTSQSETVLVPLERILGALTGKGVLFRVEPVIPEKLKNCSVELIGSWLGRSVDLSSGAPELCRKDSGLYLELLQSVNRWQDHVRVEVDISILNTIQREVIELAPLARDRDILPCARPTLALVCDSGAAKAIAHVGTQRSQLQKVASVQRHFDDPPVFDDCSDRCILCCDERSRA